MSVILLVMTDGRRQYLKPSVASLQARVDGPFVRRVFHDDSGDPAYRSLLRSDFPDWEIIGATEGRRGCCGAYASAWAWLSQQPEVWVFSTEDDFLYTTDVDLNELMTVMVARPYLAEVTLRRQPWGTEPADGGFIAQFPALYDEVTDGTFTWLEHRRHWSNNPGLFRRAVCDQGWPAVPGCEVVFTQRLLTANPDARFAVWGGRDDPPRVHHIGYERLGHSY